MNTQFIRRGASALTTTKGKMVAGSSLGVSAALIIWMYSTFATKAEMDQLRAWNKSLSQRILKLEQKGNP